MDVEIPPDVQHHNQTELLQMFLGDLIEFKRGMYSHWGVYVGNNRVIHLSGENDGIGDGWQDASKKFTICGRSFNKAFVKEDDFYKVAMDSKAYRNNQKDRKVSPSSAMEIVHRARSKIGEIGYNVLWKNCEHFAAWCRYDIEWSEQVDTFLTYAAIGTTVAAFSGLAMALTRSKQKKN